ncbi:general substrate transporter [Bisporella sp. PMI_857]|nr:general substrate transporter [Bisporella sp. PMI_857]
MDADKVPAAIEMENSITYDTDEAAIGHQLVEAERALGLFSSLKLHKKIVLICMASFSAGMAFGYDTVVNSASMSMPAFLIYFGDMTQTGPYLPSIWTSLWTAMSSLTQILGSFLVGPISDRYGRKWPTVVAAAITMAGTAKQYEATSRGLLLGGKMVSGFGIGAALATATSYASEISPLRIRGVVQSSLVLFTVLMQGMALGVIRAFVPNIAESSFRIVLALQWAVGGILMLAFALVPESPVYLISRNHIPQARAVLATLHGPANAIDARLAYLVKEIREENFRAALEPGSYPECFQGSNLKRTLTVIFVFSTPGVCGASFLAQSIYFLITVGLAPIHCFDVGIGGFGLAAVLIVGSWFTAGKIGRRTNFIVGAAVNGMGMLIIGALAYAPGQGALLGIAVLMNVLISWQIVTLLSTSFIVSAELSSFRLRGKTQAIGMMSYAFFTWLFNFIVPYMYNVDSGNLGAKTGFVFMGLCVGVAVICWWLIPDTTGMTTEEVDWLYSRNVSVRRFAEKKDEMSAHFSQIESGKASQV